MVALAPAGWTASPASRLASYAGLAAARPAGSARPTGPVEAAPASQGPAVLAQISDAARALLARMREQGVSAASFDLHLDLDRLGVSVDGRGNRSVEGHGLSVDLRVEAQQGVLQTEDGALQFERLHVEFEMTETHVVVHESAGSTPGRGLEESLRALGRLLADATRGSDQTSFALEDLLEQLGERVDRLRDLLARIGQSLQSRAADRPAGGCASGERPAGRAAGDGAAARAQSVQLAFEVQLKTLSLTRSAASVPAAAPPAQALESAAPV
jgi:hypothetical protein